MSAGDEFHRRGGDARDDNRTDEAILQHIRDAKDDSQKNQLLLLYQINQNQLKTSQELNHVADKLSDLNTRVRTQEEQTAAFTKLLNKGSGAYRTLAITMTVVVILIGCIGSLAAYIFNDYVSDLRKVALDAGAIRADMIAEIGKLQGQVQELRSNTPISREADRRLLIVEKSLTDVLANQIDNRQHFAEVERALGRALEQRGKR